MGVFLLSSGVRPGRCENTSRCSILRPRRLGMCIVHWRVLEGAPALKFKCLHLNQAYLPPQPSLLTTATSCQQGNMVSSCDISTHSFPLNSIILVTNLLQTKNNLGWLMVFPRPLHMGLIRAGRDYRGILSGPLHPHVPNPLPQIS